MMKACDIQNWESLDADGRENRVKFVLEEKKRASQRLQLEWSDDDTDDTDDASENADDNDDDENTPITCLPTKRKRR